MTTNQEKAHWEALAHCTTPLESKLHQGLVEHLNSEVVLKTVDSVSTAIDWLRKSFLYICLQRNPTHYGINARASATPDQLLESLLVAEIASLATDGIIAGSPGVTDESIESLQPTSLGKIMSRYFISIKTFRLFVGLKQQCDMRAILMALASASEFDALRIRAAEKSVSASA